MAKPTNFNFFKVVEAATESKYKNKITVVNGITFHSRKEANRFVELQLLERGGLITGLKRQVTFVLIPAGKGKGESAIKYVADFVYTENGKTIVEDVKGYITPIYKIKRRLMKVVHDIDIREV